MASLISEFVASLGRPIRGFPPLLRQTYSETMERFQVNPLTSDFDQINTNEGFEDPTLRGAAHRMYWWFPTHFFKFQDALLRWEQKCRESNQAMLLDRPKVVFIDLGCGAGAASAALLATLEQYQTFCRARNRRVDPIRVRIIALDPVQSELDIFREFIGTYASRIEQHKVFVSLSTICQRFPEGTLQILEEVSRLRGHALIVGMSNLIAWIWNEWDRRWQAKDLAAIEKLQPVEIDALQQVATQANFDCFHVIGIATKTRKLPFLWEKLSAFAAKLIEIFRLSRRPHERHWREHAKVLFENPEGSRWARQKPQGKSDYFVENLVNVSPGYIQDNRLQEALSMKSLEAAWAKVRSYMRYESLVDWIEIKLFEDDLQTNLLRLRVACLERDYDCLNVEYDLPYPFPKDEQRTRPRSLARFEDQIIATAVGISFAKELKGSCSQVSYSHRLAPFGSEFLYQYWFELYRKYTSDVLKRLDDSSVCATDIKSYYVNIPQAKLLDIVCEQLYASGRCHELVAATIGRDCHAPHQAGYGLLQGHALSGLLANVMLQPADDRLLNHCGMRGRYSRFTDDITVTGSTDPSTDERQIRTELTNLDRALELNAGKTEHFSQRDYKRKLQGFKELETVGVRFRALLLPLFATNRTYRQEFNRSGWTFVYEYQRLLKGIGVDFSPEWLYRKLDEFDQLWRQVKAFRRKWRINWPDLSLASSASGRLQWEQEFERRNATWVDEKQALKNELSSMLKNAGRALIDGRLKDESLIRRKRLVKFALYRLSIFGVEGAVHEITRLAVSQPWNIPAGLACQALARVQQEDALVAICDESESSYVRAVALKALGRIRTGRSVSLLASILDHDAEQIEKLAATEALLDANLWQGIDLDRMRGWLGQEAGSPYIQKNIVLILAQAHPEEARGLLREIDNSLSHPIVHQAIHYALTKPPAENLLWKAEPEVLRKYRAKFYPTIEELLADEGSYALVS